MFTKSRFRKKYDVKPSYDSDGGSDYVDGVDSLDAIKFNHRWNGEDVLLSDIEQTQQLINSALQNSLLLSFAYSPLLATKKPFDYELVGLKFKVKPEQSGIIINEINKPKFPNIIFHDYFWTASNWTITGSSNLHEIQNDYSTDGENVWYRIGHDGGESPVVSVMASKDIGVSVSLGKIDIQFKDFLNAPATFKHAMRIKSSDGTGYIEIASVNGSTNYTIYCNIWNGSSYTASTVDSTVARSAGLHTVSIESKENLSSVKYVVVSIDGNVVYTSSVGSYLINMRTLEFDSNSTSTASDYFDIYRFTAIQESSFTLTANTVNYVYIDLSDFTIKTTVTQATALSNLCLYCIKVPSGATSLIDSYVFDYRHSSNIVKNIYSSSVSATTITGTTITGTTINTPQLNRVFYVTTLAEFTAWMAIRAEGDIVYVMSSSTIVYSTSAQITLSGVTIIGTKVGYPSGQPQNAYSVQFISTSSDVVIYSGCYFKNIAFSDLSGSTCFTTIASASGITFDYCFVKGLRTSAGSRNVVFYECVCSGTLIGTWGYSFIGGTIAIGLSNASSTDLNENVLFKGCWSLELTNPTSYTPTDLYYHKSIRVIGCTITTGLQMYYTKGSVITGCTFTTLTGYEYVMVQDLIYLVNCMDITFSGNAIQRYSDDLGNASPVTCKLISIGTSKRITIANNSIRVLTNDADADGYFNYIKLINVVNSSSVNIVGNNIKVGGETGITNGPRDMWGIYIDSSTQININGNIITMARYMATSPTNIAIYATTVVNININGNTLIFDNPYSTVGLPAADFGIKFVTVTYALIIGNIIRDLSTSGSITYIDIGGSASVKPTTLTDFNYEYRG